MQAAIEYLQQCGKELAALSGEPVCVALFTESQPTGATGFNYFVRVGAAHEDYTSTSGKSLEAAISEIRAEIADHEAARRRELERIRTEAERLGYVLEPKAPEPEAQPEPAVV